MDLSLCQEHHQPWQPSTAQMRALQQNYHPRVSLRLPLLFCLALATYPHITTHGAACNFTAGASKHSSQIEPGSGYTLSTRACSSPCIKIFRSPTLKLTCAQVGPTIEITSSGPATSSADCSVGYEIPQPFYENHVVTSSILALHASLIQSSAQAP